MSPSFLSLFNKQQPTDSKILHCVFYSTFFSYFTFVPVVRIKIVVVVEIGNLCCLAFEL